MRKLSEEKLAAERERLEQMKSYERQYGDHILVCGIDEAGRGPLAGPVVAGAVILPGDCEILFLNDSKKLSEKRREELFLEIQEKAVSFAVGVVGPERIDEINILQATYEAMRLAVSQLTNPPQVLLNDAGSDYQGRCEERFHSGGQHYGEGYEGSYDGGVRQAVP